MTDIAKADRKLAFRLYKKHVTGRGYVWSPECTMPADVQAAIIEAIETTRAAQPQPGRVEGMVPPWFPLLGTPFAIRRDMLNEEQAQRNHGQSLTRLAERGGLSPNEAQAVVERRVWRFVAAKDAYAALIAAAPTAGGAS